MTTFGILGAAAAIALPAIGVALGEGLTAKKSLEVIGKNPDIKGFVTTITILGIALVESAAIYGLLIANSIIGSSAGDYAMLAAGLAIGIAGLAVGYAEGKVAAQAIESVLRNPSNKNTIMTNMILYIALVESAAIYALLVAQSILSK